MWRLLKWLFLIMDYGRINRQKYEQNKIKACYGNQYKHIGKAGKTAVDYTKDKSIQYIKAKEMILEYIRGNDFITNEKTRELCGFTKQQARMTIDKMRKENLIELRGVGKKSCYVLCSK